MRKWLVPLLAVLMLIGVAIAFVPFSRQMETRAKTELTLVMDRAFARIAAGDHLVDPMVEAEKESLLSKAVAVSRFLTHDDSLLASDALTALCEQLSIDQIDVADADGTLIASSSAANVGTALGTQEAFTWTMAAAEDATAALTQQDATDPSVLYACVGRSDIEGFILLTRDDAHVESILMLSNADTITSDLPYGGDVLFTAEKGDDGFFYESNNLCLRRTQDGVTLIAARPTCEVFAVRNAALLAFAAALACIMICGVAAYLINLEVVSTSDDDDREEMRETREPREEQTLLEDELILEALPEERENPRRRSQKKRKRFVEEAEETAEAEVEQQHEQALEHAPRQVVRGKKKAHAAKDEPQLLNDEDAFEKIVD
ncbi:MAG: hypothetical protein PHW41_03925 [Eubacteriales bacterium]|nr:hypothetical protein [Eubacteriales bacterium]